MSNNLQNLVTVLQQRAKQHRKDLAYLFLEDGEAEKVSVTYEEIDKKARAVASYLQRRQTLDQRVILLYPAGIDFITAFIGCLYAGVTAIPMSCASLTDFKKIQDVLVAIIKDSSAKCLLTVTNLMPVVKEFLDGFVSDNTLFLEDTSNISASMAEQYQLPNIHDNTVVYLQYTSGSTSSPKGVIIKHKNLSHTLKFTAKEWGYSKESKTLVWAPHSHVYGLICGLLVPFYHGTLSIIIPSAVFIKQPICWLKAISKYQVSHSGCPNFGYEHCIQEINVNQLDGINLSCWKVAINGGEQVRQETLIKFVDKFSPFGFDPSQFCSSYGMSELTGFIASTKYGQVPDTIIIDMQELNNNQVIKHYEQKEGTRTFVSSGKLLYGLNVVIVDPNTLLLARENEIGEVWLSGISLAEGYWNRIEENVNIFQARLITGEGPYFRTGDLGFIDNNKLYLTGRLKELIIVYGKNYYPLDLETIANTAHKNLENENSAAFSIDFSQNEEAILVQEISENMADQADEIIKLIRQAITEQRGLDLYSVVLVKQGTIPKTISGKIQRNLCKQWYLDKKLVVIQESTKKRQNNYNKQLIVPTVETDLINHHHSLRTSRVSIMSKFQDQLVTIIANVLQIEPHEIKLNEQLSRYGFDSLSLSRLASSVNKMYNLNLTPALLFEYKTLEEFFLDLWDKYGNIIEEQDQIRFLEKRISSNEAIRLSPIPLNSSFHKIEGHQLTETEDIAVIGMSGIFPGSPDLNTFWENLIQEKDLISEIPIERWNWKEYYGELEDNKTKVKWGGFIEGIDQFDASFFNISPHEAELMDPQQRLLLQIVWHVIEHAGYTPDSLSRYKTGLFVGVSTVDYTELLLRTRNTPAQFPTGTFRSILANRVSYLLNFQGPSEAIDTACSSSLVALHHAIKGIQGNDCEVAVVAGVNALLTPTLYLAASKAGMLSEDGRCKTFDKSANGFVRGEGVGAILLKSFSKAKADRDIIYGIIKGSASNHGGHVSSLTVPNPNAQAELIVNAIEKANIDIETISYIETHGTGTSLGDPIEINGLKKAFQILQERQGKPQIPHHYCGLGSVKANIGHLEAAAGMAGIIKILLMLQHKQLPGQVHLKELNPQIELKNSPFYIVSELSDWQHIQPPRRAGISSFGFGGSNAHVIVEEWPEYISFTHQTKPFYLITLSAKHLDSLNQRIKDLYTYLKDYPELPIEAIAYTLNVCRVHFNYRIAFVVSSKDELLNKLQQWLKNPDKKLVGYFHGMANQEHDDAPIYKQVLEMSLENLKYFQTIDVGKHKDLLEAVANLYTKGYDVDWEALHTGETHQKISLPTYPFLKERYWIPEVTDKINLTTSDIGITRVQQSVLHPLVSTNTSTAEERLPIVNVDLNLSILEQQADLKTTLSLAVQRLFMLYDETLEQPKTFTGIKDALGIIPFYEKLLIEHLQLLCTEELLIKEQQYYHKKQAFKFEPLLETNPYVRLLSQCLSQTLEVMQGKKQATEVLFPGGSLELVTPIYQTSELNAINHKLAELVQQFIAKQENISILEIGAGTGSTSRFVLEALKPYQTKVRYYFTDISWKFIQMAEEAFAKDYPFLELAILDIEQFPEQIGQMDIVIAANVLHATTEINKTLEHCKSLLKQRGSLLLLEATKKTPFLTLTFGLTPGWWSFKDNYRIPGSPLLSSSQWRVLLSTQGWQNIQITEFNSVLGLSIIQAQSDDVIRKIQTKKSLPNNLQIGGSNSVVNQNNANNDVAERQNELCFFVPTWEPRSLVNSPSKLNGSIVIFDESNSFYQKLQEKYPDLTVIQVSSGKSYKKLTQSHIKLNKAEIDDLGKLFDELEEQNMLPQHIIYRTHLSELNTIDNTIIHNQLHESYRPLFAISKLLTNKKYPYKLQVLVMNESNDASPSPFVDALSAFVKAIHSEYPKLTFRIINRIGQKEDLIDPLLDEISSNDIDIDVCYDQNGHRMVKTYQEINNPISSTLPLLKKHGVYLMTGGAGGLGLLFAHYFASLEQIKLVLVGRSDLKSDQIEKIDQIRKLRSEVIYLQADITQYEDVQQVITKTKRMFGPLNGILHIAGIVKPNLIFNKNWAEIMQVISPKVQGTLYLDELTKAEPLDFFVLFSSISTLFGDVGLGISDYAYGNGFMDAYAHIRHKLTRDGKRSGRSVAINWGHWLEGGMQIQAEEQERLKQQLGMMPFVQQETLGAFKNVLDKGDAQTVILAGNKQKIVENISTLSSASVVLKVNTPTIVSNYSQLTLESIQSYLSAEIGRLLKLKPENIHLKKHFTEYGIDSIYLTSLVNKINRDFGIIVQPAAVFTYSTIDTLSQYLIEHFSPQLPREPESDLLHSLPTTNQQQNNVEIINNNLPLRLFCFPYAGGTPWIFSKWSSYLPSNIQVQQIDPHFTEHSGVITNIRTVTDIVQNLVNTLSFDVPFAFVGSCLGALVAFELTKELERREKNLPKHLFFIACAAPHLYPIAMEDTIELIDRYRKEVGAEKFGRKISPEEYIKKQTEEVVIKGPEVFLTSLEKIGFRDLDKLRTNKDLLDASLPRIITDASVAMNYKPSDTILKPLPIPLTVFDGKNDETIQRGFVKEWKDYTTKEFSYNELPGDHYIIHSAKEIILAKIKAALAEV